MNEIITIDFRKAIIALSDALDLVGVDETEHSKRVAYIAYECGKRLGLDKDSCDELFEIGLIHDIGVSETSVHKHLVGEFEWEGENIHCQTGFELIKDFPPLSEYAYPLLYHHTPWDKLKDIKLSSRHKRFANIIHLADKINTFTTPHYLAENFLQKTTDICAEIENQKNSHFNVSVATAFLDIAKCPAFWIGLDSRYLTNFINDRFHIENPKDLCLKEVKSLAEIFASIVDAKSKFTAEHSFNVAALCFFISETYGLSQSICAKIEIAGLLHDLGKLRIPDEILDKNGSLTERERTIINQHSFETYEILRKIPGLEDIALWAGYHHETLNQKGYPFLPSTEKIGIEARIISIADIFQALAQKRPYRPSISAIEILNILEKMVAKGEIDEMLVEIVKENLDTCYQIAIAEHHTSE